MAGRIRSFDWASTPLGPIARWPQSLRTIVDLMLASRSMMSLVWGPEAIHLYNDSFTELLREHRVLALGKSAYETFARSRDVFEADIAAGMAGRSARLPAQRYPVLRQGRLEDAWFDVEYAPIRDEAGAVGGVLWTLKETTAQHLAEQALRASEAWHRLLIESWAQAMWETDADGVVVADSPSWRAYTGQTLEEWLGYGWLDAIHPDDRSYAERQWREAMAARGPVDAEFRLRARDGGWRWTNVRAAPVLDRAGRIEKWAGINIDIDARKRAEIALRESDLRLAQMADAAPVLIWETGEEGATYVNSHYLAYFGVGFEGIAGFGWARFIHPDDLAGYIAAYRQAFAERRPYDYACRLLRADGQYRWHRTSGGPAGEGRFIGSSTDIHDLVVAERALREREERLRGVLDGMAEGFGLLGPDFTILEHNAEALRMDGRLREDIVGRSHWDVYPESEDSELGRLLKRAMIERVPVALEHHYAWESGRALWLDMRAYPTADGALAVFWRDVTDRRETEVALRESEGKYRALFESMDEAYAVVEVLKDEAGAWADFRFIEVNPAFLEHTSMPWPVGQTATALLGEPNPRWTELYGQTLDTGEPIRVEETEPTLDRIFDLNIFTLDRARNRVAVLFTNVTERKRAEAALRESEELRRIALESGEMGAWTWNIRERSVRADAVVQKLWGLSISEQPHAVSLYADLMTPEGVAWLEAGTKNEIAPGDLVHSQMQVAHGPTAGRWVQLRGRAEGDRPWLINGVSFDITAQKHAEQRLRDSEERFSQFAASSADGLWIRDAGTMAMEYASPAVEAIYGVPPDAILGDPKHWAALIVPEDRDAALQHLERARAGAVVVHEFRIQRPTDGAFRWIRNTDFPLRDASGRVRRVGGIAQDVTEAKLAVEHTAVLLAELQHRVRNIMAIIRSIAARTGERAESVPEYAALMAGRLLTLARVQVLLTRAANAGVGIARIVRDELDAQAQHAGQFTIEGPDLVLAPKAAEVLTLAVHELTTNALKYGALSTELGCVSVRWTVFERRGTSWLGFDWIEARGPERPPSDPAGTGRRGFGRELIEGRIPYELGGRGRLAIEPGGARCRLEFPLRDGHSVLETDAPQRARVFGGAIDMTGEADLRGLRVLVVEDDFYLATDTARALQGAGANVLGPCPNEEAARDALADEHPDAAVVDINLGAGPSFKLAETLKDRGIPFVFTTGYDPEVIPTEFEGVQRLQKPVPLRQIVAAVSKLLEAA